MFKIRHQEGVESNNGHQEEVTSIHFVNIKAKLLQNTLDSNPDQQILIRPVILCYNHSAIHTSVIETVQVIQVIDEFN